MQWVFRWNTIVIIFGFVLWWISKWSSQMLLYLISYESQASNWNRASCFILCIIRVSRFWSFWSIWPPVSALLMSVVASWRFIRWKISTISFFDFHIWPLLTIVQGSPLNAKLAFLIPWMPKFLMELGFWCHVNAILIWHWCHECQMPNIKFGIVI